MLTLPARIRRKKQTYLAIRARLLKRQIPRHAELFFPEVRKYFADEGITNAGPSFCRYNMVSPAGEMDMEFGIITDRLYNGSGPIRAGILPAGSFVSVKWTGHPAKLSDVDAMLMGWSTLKGVECDCVTTEAAVFFGCRVDIFHKAQPTEPNLERWETEVAIMLKSKAAG